MRRRGMEVKPLAMEAQLPDMAVQPQHMRRRRPTRPLAMTAVRRQTLETPRPLTKESELLATEQTQPPTSLAHRTLSLELMLALLSRQVHPHTSRHLTLLI